MIDLVRYARSNTYIIYTISAKTYQDEIFIRRFIVRVNGN